MVWLWRKSYKHLCNATASIMLDEMSSDMSGLLRDRCLELEAT